MQEPYPDNYVGQKYHVVNAHKSKTILKAKPRHKGITPKKGSSIQFLHHDASTFLSSNTDKSPKGFVFHSILKRPKVKKLKVSPISCRSKIDSLIATSDWKSMQFQTEQIVGQSPKTASRSTSLLRSRFASRVGTAETSQSPGRSRERVVSATTRRPMLTGVSTNINTMHPNHISTLQFYLPILSGQDREVKPPCVTFSRRRKDSFKHVTLTESETPHSDRLEARYALA